MDAFLRLRRIFLLFVAVFAAVFIGSGMMLTAMQRGMIFYPHRLTWEEEQKAAHAEGFHPWMLKGERVGWRSPGESPRVVIFHGNASCAVYRGYLVRQIQEAASPQRPEVYIFEYPGYGSRAGSPSEGAFVGEAVTAVKSLGREQADPVFLVGESLGTGVACQVAGKLPEMVAGVLLLTPFDSLVSAAAHHYPWLPVRWILRDRFDSRRALEAYAGPVVIILADNDRIVPAALGEKLYHSYAGPKLLLRAPGAGHNDLGAMLPGVQWREAWNFMTGGP